MVKKISAPIRKRDPVKDKEIYDLDIDGDSSCDSASDVKDFTSGTFTLCPKIGDTSQIVHGDPRLRKGKRYTFFPESDIQRLFKWKQQHPDSVTGTFDIVYKVDPPIRDKVLGICIKNKKTFSGRYIAPASEEFVNHFSKH